MAATSPLVLGHFNILSKPGRRHKRAGVLAVCECVCTCVCMLGVFVVCVVCVRGCVCCVCGVCV